MKFSNTITTFSFLTLTAAHSWLSCTDHDNKNIIDWMKSNVTECVPVLPIRPDCIVDPLMPWFAYLCKGWPRAKQNPGDWQDESSNYLWSINEATAKVDTHAYHPSQRTPTYFTFASDPALPHHTAPAAMATSTPGGTIKLMYGGNGYSRGANAGGNGDAGRVGFTPSFLMQENGFSEEAIMFPDDDKVVTPNQGLVDKGNWMSLKLPGVYGGGTTYDGLGVELGWEAKIHDVF
ncbi:hypothetical protein EK21DRAFT_109527 [Setomelanomma holmii]|uniref:Uncharacterized protein n=1 Tax=Setomelanomma holmii TaxID=210430 RepID=A0A9P4HGD3_9PLEO|nr:hypothetical protein EK21DRAFT_109527 [Setomelanomma holmii]